MATIGVSKPYVAEYIDNGDGTVSYARGVCLAKATEISAAIEAGEDNNLYADNGIAESDKSFAGGKLTLGVDDLMQEGSKLILGVQESKVTVNGTEVTELVYDDDTTAPYLGFGCIIKKKKGSFQYRAVVFPKIMFGIPEDAATTQGKSIEWKTPSLAATIMRDDSKKHMWKREATFDSEAEAEAYIKSVLQVTGGTLGKLVLSSTAGTSSGNTKITVSPVLSAGNTYKYTSAASVTLPAHDESCTTGYTAWDGTAEISATTGQKLLLVEVGTNDKAKKAGIATVTAKV